MKHPLLCLIAVTALVFACEAVSVGQWYSQNSGTRKTLNAVTFTDTSNGFAVGDSGIILRTSDAGASWVEQVSGTTNHLYKVCFIDVNTGFAVGDSGTILKTDNGGSSWSQISTGNGYALNGVCFVDAVTGWAVGGTPYSTPPAILHTTNGGIDWSPQTYGDTLWLNAVRFLDRNLGWAVGWRGYPNYEGIILKTTNGGTNWTPQTSGTDRVLYDAEFISANTGWVVGGAIGPLPHAEAGHPVDDGPGIVLKTVDGGIIWTTQVDTIEEALFGLSFVDSSVGFAVGYYHGFYGYLGGTILCTTDGGINWMRQPTEDSYGFFRAVDFTSANTGWVVGEDVDWDSGGGNIHRGMILHTTNGGVTSVDEGQPVPVPTDFSLAQNYPNPFNPSTTIRYGVPRASHVTLTVHNLLGQEVARLVNEQKAAGYHDVVFCSDGLASGVYFTVLEAGGAVATSKMILLR